MIADIHQELVDCAEYCERGSLTRIQVDAEVILEARREIERLMSRLNDVEMIADEKDHAIAALAVERDEWREAARVWEQNAIDNERCRSSWQLHRCVLPNGHAGIHYAENEWDWIDGDSRPLVGAA